jgi:biopolymer transport protein ExbD
MRKRKEEPTPEVELPVTPMLDMTFQLLAFFIMTFKPASMVEGQMEFSLPASGEARAKTPDQVDPDKVSDSELALKSQITVILNADQGNISSGTLVGVRVQTPSNPGIDVKNIEGLLKFLKDQRSSQDITNKDDIQLQADSNLRYAFVIKAMDACTRAGFTRVGFSPPPDLTTAPKD